MALRLRLTEHRPFAKTLHLDGRLDNETVAALDKELDPLVDSTATVVVIDLAGLDYISSIGLRSIFRLQKRMAARNGQALLINPTPQVKKVLDIVAATDIAAVFASVQELDDYLDLMQRKITEG